MLEKAREKLSNEIISGRVVDITEAKMPRLPYPDSSFDVVLFNLVLHHLQGNPDGVNYPEIEEVLSEAKRVVKKDGVIAIGTGFPETYMSRIWFTKFSESMTSRFKQRFPNFVQFSKIMDKNRLRLLSKLDHYSPSTPETLASVTDPLGPTKKAWRDANSYWACGTTEEITEIERKILKMHEDGELEEFVKENNSIDNFFYMAFLFVTPM